MSDYYSQNQNFYGQNQVTHLMITRLLFLAVRSISLQQPMVPKRRKRMGPNRLLSTAIWSVNLVFVIPPVSDNSATYDQTQYGKQQQQSQYGGGMFIPSATQGMSISILDGNV